MAEEDEKPKKKIRGVDESLILHEPRKRRRADGSPEGGEAKQSPYARQTSKTHSELVLDEAAREDLQKKGQYLYDKVTSLRDVDGRLMHLDFMELPSETDYPDYYEQIKKPISYSEVKAKLENSEYTSLEQVYEDIKQCYVNAKRYNAPGSVIFLDAKHLHKLLKESYRMMAGEGFEFPNEAEDDDEPLPPRATRKGSVSVSEARSVTPQAQATPTSTSGGPKRGPTLKPWLAKKYKELTDLRDERGRPYYEGFKTLPDRAQWPEYYEVITHPMALDQVSAKITKRAYTTVQQYIDEVTVTFDNALYFNEETSRIWKDAKKLKNHFLQTMSEIPPVFVPPRKYNTARRRAEEEARKAAILANPGMAYLNDSRASAGPDGGAESPAYDESGGEEEDYEMGYEETPYHHMPSEVVTAPLPMPLPAPIPPADPFALPPGSAAVVPAVAPSPLAPVASLPSLASASPESRSLPLGIPSPSVFAQPSLPSPAFASSPVPSPVFSAPNPQLATLPNGSASLPVVPPASPMERVLSNDPSTKKRLISRMPTEDDLPAISRFLVRTTPPTLPITLDNTTVRQHSFVVPQSTERVDFSPFFRRSPPAADGTSTPAPEPIVKLAARPQATAFESVPEPAEGDAPSQRYTLVPNAGLTVIEITVTSKPTDGSGKVPEPELYRIFLTK